MYKDFAGIYDVLMKNVDYEKWTDFIEEILQQYGLRPVSVVDLACGTGGITTVMGKRGYQMTGVDISEEMLFAAREKARMSGLRIPYVCQDMVQLELHRPVDAITCMCDGFNYLLDEKAVEKALLRIHACLKPGGVLIFDISSYYKLCSVLGNHTMTEIGEAISLIWNNRFDREKNILQMDLTFFIQEGRYYRRADETHLQRAYHEEEMIELLKKCHFGEIRSYAPFQDMPPKKRSHRIFFAARKGS